MNDQVLSIKQMKVLKDLGANIDNASMCYTKIPNSDSYYLTIHDEYCYECSGLDPIPTFTLMDMLVELNAVEIILQRVNDKYEPIDLMQQVFDVLCDKLTKNAKT